MAVKFLFLMNSLPGFVSSAVIMYRFKDRWLPSEAQLRINITSAHIGRSARYSYYKSIGLFYSWVLTTLFGFIPRGYRDSGTSTGILQIHNIWYRLFELHRKLLSQLAVVRKLYLTDFWIIDEPSRSFRFSSLRLVSNSIYIIVPIQCEITVPWIISSAN